MAAPVVALVLGAGVATGAYALIDQGAEAVTSKVIVVESPAPNAADIPGKNEASTAAAIAPSQGTDLTGKNEANTAAAISQSSGVELRGSKASPSDTSAQDADVARRTDPHGAASSLHDR
jgi:hypothetical protein